MPVAIEALIPITLTVMIGYLARHHFSVSDAVWAGLERLTYYLFAPALLIASLANKPLAGLPWQGILTTLIAVLLLASLITIVWQYFVRPVDMASFTSVFQGGVRFNSFVALALADNLFGAEGLLIGALATVVVIITVNILCVSVFSLTNPNNGGFKKLPKQLASNPLILGCVVGLSLNLSGMSLYPALDNLLMMLGSVDVLSQPQHCGC